MENSQSIDKKNIVISDFIEILNIYKNTYFTHADIKRIQSIYQIMHIKYVVYI